MDQEKQSLIARLDQATNILVTVSANPSIDQLAACIGLTLYLNKIGKHATAVFSGEVPSTIEFLDPGATIEKNTDSLRDFIISLDKAKADKLRYKVEENVVRIFITPYRVSLTDKDLNFSQGDFNVEVIIALGVAQKEDLDIAITAHGRILHDATVMTISNTAASGLGSINWSEPSMSSLSEMVTSMAEQMKPGQIDNQIATSLLTGIVAETERFSNDKTSPITMSVSAKLMSAGANQQLISTKLKEPLPIPPVFEEPTFEASEEAAIPDPAIPAEAPVAEMPKPITHDTIAQDGTLTIAHLPVATSTEELMNYSVHEEEPEEEKDIDIDEHGNLLSPEQVEERRHAKEAADAEPEQQVPEPEEPAAVNTRPSRITEPPSRGGTLTGSTQSEVSTETNDPLSQHAPLESILSHSEGPAPEEQADLPELLNPEAETQEVAEQTLDDLEHDVDSPHVSSVEDARNAVDEANHGSFDPNRPEALKSVGAQPLGQINHQPTDSKPMAIADILAQASSSDPEVGGEEVGKQSDPQQPPAPQVPPPMMPPLPGNLTQPPSTGGNPLFGQ